MIHKIAFLDYYSGCVMRQSIWRIIDLIAVAIILCMSACDADSDVSSIPPWDTDGSDTSVIESDIQVRVHLADVSADDVALAELRYGIGRYETELTTHFAAGIRVSKSQLTKSLPSDTQQIVSFPVTVSIPDNTAWYCNVRLLNSDNVCIGNLAEMWQSDTIDGISVIDVTCDGVYGEINIEYNPR